MTFSRVFLYRAVGTLAALETNLSHSLPKLVIVMDPERFCAGIELCIHCVRNFRLVL